MKYWGYESYSNDNSMDFIEDYSINGIEKAWEMYCDEECSNEEKAEYLGIFMYYFLNKCLNNKDIIKECINIIDEIKEDNYLLKMFPDEERRKTRLNGERILLNNYLKTGEYSNRGKPRKRPLEICFFNLKI